MTHSLLYRCATASFGGIVATAPMTMFMEWADGKNIAKPGSSLPPRRIVEEAAKGLTAQPPSEAIAQGTTRGAHYGYGATVATFYGLRETSDEPTTEVVAGAMFGLGVWAGSYLGLLPALGSSARATNQPRPTNELMIAAHLIWGASLGLTQFAIRRP